MTEIAAATPIVDAQLGSLFTACVVRVEREGQREALAAGTLCPDDRAGPDAPCTVDSVFDLASLTKLATTALLLSFVRERQLTLDTPLRELVPDFKGAGKDRVTLFHVLTGETPPAQGTCSWRRNRRPLIESLNTKQPHKAICRLS